MARRRLAMLRLLLTVAAALPAAAGLAQSGSQSPAERAVGFLAVEVPRWKAENGCYSCHNNGDAARALAVAQAAGLLDDRAPLADTLRFLAAPEGWDANGPDGPFKDKKLARIQFAAALVEAEKSGLLDGRAALQSAADLVAENQLPAGNWETDAAGGAGSPATYGGALASFLAWRTLEAAGAEKHRAAIVKARRWFQTAEPTSVLAAAATLLALEGDGSGAAARQRARALALIRRGESPDGGWGPFVNSPPETFDTAVVLLALAAPSVGVEREGADVDSMLARGRRYLLSGQLSDGSWPATTRPPGADSYAQRLSTSAWATLALLATRRETAAR